MKEEEKERIISFVKKEPRTVQEIARLIGKSWVTTNTYVQHIRETTGRVDMKVFRKGTQGALKLVFVPHEDAASQDEVKGALYQSIKVARRKQDIDFMDIFQHIPSEEKQIEEKTFDRKKSHHLPSLFQQTQRQLLVFSGNFSFLRTQEKNTEVLKAFKEMIERNVIVKVLCRVNRASMNNVQAIEPWLKKQNVEVRHTYQPLRGFISDHHLARFGEDMHPEEYREGELQEKVHLLYEITNNDWIVWLEKVFWNLWRTSLSYEERVKELKAIHPG